MVFIDCKDENGGEYVLSYGLGWLKMDGVWFTMLYLYLYIYVYTQV